MEKKKVDVSSPEFMEAMAAVMREALDSQEGLRALAAAIAAPIEQEIKRKEINVVVANLLKVAGNRQTATALLL